jgi:hypothetical protein
MQLVPLHLDALWNAGQRELVAGAAQLLHPVYP